MRETQKAEMYEEIISSEPVFQGRIFDVTVSQIELSDGSRSSRELVDHPGGACIVALTEDLRVYLVEQYRIAFAETLYEIPAGKLFRGEEPLLCAQRELKEETGLEASSWTLLSASLPSPGYTNETIYIYLARDLKIGQAEPDQGEFLEVLNLPLAKALAWARTGKIRDAKTIIGLLMTADLIGETH